MATKRSTTRKPAQGSADLIDKQLERYRSMRDFKVTQEPAGSRKIKSQEKQLPFVIQKHAATRLHYDFRLGWNGVLKSWAVAKGPSYRTPDKRLAVQVEDHPMEYGGFEGIIPKGQYGGGTVMLWDTGTWEPQTGHEDVDAGLRDGSLKFIMHGTKMKGKWALIRMGGKAASEGKPNWLLIKEHDEFERGPEDADILEEMPNSVVTGRNLEKIADSGDHVWDSNKTASGKAWHRRGDPPDEGGKEHAGTERSRGDSHPKTSVRGPGAKVSAGKEMSAYPDEKLPAFIAPQLAIKAHQPPQGSGWLHELKLDGYRIEVRKSGAEVKLLTRTGLDWTHRMKPLASEFAKLSAKNLILDGEVVVLARNGTTSFADLQAAFQEGTTHRLTYFAFDLLHLNGKDLRGAPLAERKRILAGVLQGSDESVRLSEDIETDGIAFFQAACKLHAEGIVCKRANSKYTSGRTGQWLKVKCAYDQEFVIGGFTLPSNGIDGVGALLLGYYDDSGKLIYAGRTGTGFTRSTHQLLRSKLDKLRIKKQKFDIIPREAGREAVWVKPILVAQVNFATWTADNLVRQAAFKGLREDKPAIEVRREDVLSSSDKVSAKSGSAAVGHGSPNVTAAKVRPEPSGNRGPAIAENHSSEISHRIHLTHPNKILDNESGLTKQQLAEYYWSIADRMLPHIAHRPLSLVRCPEGSTQPCFFQKHTNNMLPPGIDSVEIADKKTGKKEPYITLSTPKVLASLAQLGVLEIHPWGSRNDDIEHPDRIIIDLDPDEEIDWKTLAESANSARRLFKKIGLETFLKSTGGKGLHVVAPIVAEHDWPAIKNFAHSFANALEAQSPSLYLTKMSKAARKGRIFIDYLRNERGATAVAAFSPRARAGLPVSMPLAWTELKSTTHPRFTVVEFSSWKSRLARDPWQGFSTVKQKLNLDQISKIR
jgi:bifunctional non-homologous end joining protein LigD